MGQPKKSWRNPTKKKILFFVWKNKCTHRSQNWVAPHKFHKLLGVFKQFCKLLTWDTSSSYTCKVGPFKLLKTTNLWNTERLFQIKSVYNMHELQAQHRFQMWKECSNKKFCADLISSRQKIRRISSWLWRREIKLNFLKNHLTGGGGNKNKRQSRTFTTNLFSARVDDRQVFPLDWGHPFTPYEKLPCGYLHIESHCNPKNTHTHKQRNSHSSVKSSNQPTQKQSKQSKNLPTKIALRKPVIVTHQIPRIQTQKTESKTNCARRGKKTLTKNVLLALGWK